MITADRHARKPSDVPRDGTVPPVAARPAASTPPLTRPRLALVSDVTGGVVVLALGAAAGFPLVWGLALHQTPMAVSAGCVELLCAIVLLNRCFAPATTRTHAVPFLAALEERPWILALCLGLALTSAVTLAAYWPGRA
jgi:hypothetical protein